MTAMIHLEIVMMVVEAFVVLVTGEVCFRLCPGRFLFEFLYSFLDMH